MIQKDYKIKVFKMLERYTQALKSHELALAKLIKDREPLHNLILRELEDKSYYDNNPSKKSNLTRLLQEQSTNEYRLVETMEIEGKALLEIMHKCVTEGMTKEENDNE